MFQNNLLMGAASISAGGLTVDDSVRYNDDDSPRLYRTPSVLGNRFIGSISLWYKRCNLGSIQQLFNSGAGNDITFNASDQLTFIDSSGVSYITTQVFRDPTAWGHLLFAWDTTLTTAGDRLRIYHNGVEITAFGTETNPDQGDALGISNTVRQTIGANESDTEEFDGYISQFYHIDGRQLTPTSFGEFNDNGIWRPIEYSGDGTGATQTVSNTASPVSTSQLSDYSGVFDDIAIGTASSDRVIVMMPIGQGATVGDRNVETLTCGGVTARRASIAQNSTEGGYVSEMWFAPVPTGTTADIDVVWNTTMYSCAFGVWAITGGNVLWDVQIDTDSNPMTANLTLPDNSCGIGGGGNFNSGTYTWSGLTEDFDKLTGASSGNLTGASDVFASATVQAVSVESSASVSRPSASFISFAPGTDYGTNGIFLDFADSSDFGNDISGNNNDYTSSGLTAADQMSDSPTNNKCTWSPIDKNSSLVLSDGNLVATFGGWINARATFDIPSSGKWSFQGQAKNAYVYFGVVAQGEGNGDMDTSGTDALYYYGSASGEIGTYRSGSKVTESTNDPPAVGVDTNMEVLIDKDNDQFGVVIADTVYMAVDAGLELQDTMTKIFVQGLNLAVTADFGQGGYEPSQTGYKALSTANLDTPTILDGTANFQTTLYTGDGSVRNIDQTGNSTFQPDMVWMKNRSQADPHMLIDATRGVTKELNPENARIQSTDANGLTSFDSDGFGLGTGAGGYNDDTENFVAWQWLAGGGAGSSNEVGSINTITTTVNTAAGISIGTYIGTGANATVGHGLGVAPQMVVVREFERVQTWTVYHEGIAADAATDYIYWDFNLAAGDDALTWNDTAPTSTVFSLGSSAAANADTFTHVYYAFANIEGYSRFSNYTGNGVVDGPVIYTGFKPALVIIKKSSGTGSWVMYDSQRSPYNEIDDQLVIDEPYAETTGSEELDFLANGFKIRTDDSDVNTSAGNYIYMAFAQYPFGGEDVTPATAF